LARKREIDPLELIRAAAAAEKQELDLASVALALAALDHPDVALKPYEAHLRDLAAEISARKGKGLRGSAIAALVRDVIADKFGYAGDSKTYDDTANADLIKVIDRRRGLPVALGILYIHVARAAGAKACGLNFPGHFLIAIESGGERVVIDPFNEGASLETGDMESLRERMTGQSGDWRPGEAPPMSDRAVLMRLLNNIRTRARAAADANRMAEVIERMLMLDASDAELWFELGLGYAATERPGAGLKALDQALRLERTAPWVAQAAELSRDLRRKLN
jgi:regulator of sirC expression with transglutaminase-like and TPR domain